ncbi:MAG: NERD domain-containing protein, partial [Syntrophaceae bacterium]|nr:NERD domain-containing protein [Syntrophaceae bacterium]
MTYMIPPVFSEDVRSSGERQVFEMLKDDPETDTWTCLHSIGLSRHVTSVYGEIDFVLLVPGEGVFCLEVKSGAVSRKAGVWKYTDKYGHVAEDTRGPFRQVSDAMFSLKNYIRDEFGQKSRLLNLLYGWAVIFPHSEFNKSGPDYEKWQVYNKTDRDRPISLFMKNLFKQTHEKMKDQRWYSHQQSRPTKNDISGLVGFLRGDFEFCVKKGSAIKNLEDEILRFTSEQVRCLDSLHNNPRCFFTGAAGTGKTVLAQEFAKRKANQNSRTLFLCYNRLLAQKLAYDLAGYS